MVNGYINDDKSPFWVSDGCIEDQWNIFFFIKIETPHCLLLYVDENAL